MKSILVYIWDSDKVKKNELTGKEGKDECYLSELIFCETSVHSYYIQQHIDSETKTRNICFFIGSFEYCCPYTKEVEKLLKSCMV